MNTALAAFLIFCDRVNYPSYAAAPRSLNLSPLETQAAAGAVMWVPGSVAYLIPIGLLTVQALGSRRRAVSPSSRRTGLPVILTRGASTSFPAGRSEGWDLLSVPIIGAALGRPRFRRAAQSAVFALALIFNATRPNRLAAALFQCRSCPPQSLIAQTSGHAPLSFQQSMRLALENNYNVPLAREQTAGAANGCDGGRAGARGARGGEAGRARTDDVARPGRRRCDG